MVEALNVILATNSDSQTGCTGHQYVIQTQNNLFTALLYRTLEPATPLGDEAINKYPGLCYGPLACATGTKSNNFFTNQFITLDRHTGMLRFYKSPHQICTR